MSDVEAVLVGPAGFARDLIVHVLQTSRVPVRGPSDPAPTPNMLVTVLLGAEADYWEVARQLAHPVVVMAPVEMDDAEVAAAVVDGADAVLHADSDPLDLLSAIDVVARGGTRITASQARLLADLARARPEVEAEPAVCLTAREIDILKSIDRGETVKQTAAALGISIKTVENLQSRLFRKLGARNRAQAVVRVHQYGLLDMR
ncbi:MAG: DNA-binding response regulator [Acidimicrobiales bacterium]|jgi:DNA-binding NarL/FixJ family response regulator|nr:DNA-binding response regulator [Acidimicrobiales bacterium]